MSEPVPSVKMPENAYRELQPGEVYAPIVPASTSIPEVTGRSVAFGLAMVAVFSAAAAYISLKLGQGIESAIPIAILAIGFSAMLARRSTLLENLNIHGLRGYEEKCLPIFSRDVLSKIRANDAPLLSKAAARQPEQQNRAAQHIVERGRNGNREPERDG